MRRVALLVLCLGLTACGASTGGDGPQAGGALINKETAATSSQPAHDSVVLKLSTRGDTSGKLISGIQFTLRLPANVVLDATSGGDVATGEVAASGMNVNPEYVMARYTPGQVKVALINSKGFSGGEFLTVSCRRTGGAVAPTDFSVEEFKAADFSPAALPDVVPTFTVEIM